MSTRVGMVRTAFESKYIGLLRLWQDKRVRIATKLILIAAFSALAAAAKDLHPSVGIPGSSAIFWLTAMVIGRAAVKMEFTGTLTGIGVAAWGIPFGLENSFGYRILLYGLTGLLLDIMTKLPKISLDNPIGAAVCGLTAHVAKFGFIVFAALSSSVTKHFVLVGFLNSALLHAAFGIAAGLIGWSIVKSGQIVLKKILIK